MAAKNTVPFILYVSKKNMVLKNLSDLIFSKSVFRNYSNASAPSIHQLRQEILQLVSEKASLINVAQLFEEDQRSIRPRRMRESCTSAMIPLKNNPDLQQQYRTAFNTIRIGKILEDLDTLAGLTCFHHNKKKDTVGLEISPVAFVTAMVDSVDVHPETKQTFVDDIRLSGMATWVGRSSVLVSMIAEQLQNDQWKSMVSAKFIMVGRSVVTNNSAKVNPLLVETEEEKAQFAQGEADKTEAKKVESESLLKMAPNAVEREYVHNLFLETIEQGNVVYTEGQNVQTRVWASVVDPADGTQETSNIFYFTFRVEAAGSAPAAALPRIVPRTYAEAMLLLDGKRHYESSVKRQNSGTTPISS